VETTAHQVTLGNRERLAGDRENFYKGFHRFLRPRGCRGKAASSNDAVNVESQKPTFWRQLKGGIDLG